jgi:hypothetical protein
VKRSFPLDSLRLALEDGPGDVRLARLNVHHQARGEEVRLLLNSWSVLRLCLVGVPPEGRLLSQTHRSQVLHIIPDRGCSPSVLESLDDIPAVDDPSTGVTASFTRQRRHRMTLLSDIVIYPVVEVRVRR